MKIKTWELVVSIIVGFFFLIFGIFEVLNNNYFSAVVSIIGGGLFISPIVALVRRIKKD